jgi:hypothetical protein
MRVKLVLTASSSNTGKIIKNNYDFSEDITVGTTFTNQLRFGSNPSGGGTPFVGGYGNIRLYNRALTPQEIQQNFNATRRRFGI